MLQRLRATLPFSQREKVAAYPPTDEGERPSPTATPPSHKPTLIQTHWQHLPLPEASLDLVLGDGSLSMVDYPHSLHAVAAELTRTLRPGGSLLVRLYTSLSQPESPNEVLDALLAHKLRDLNELKLRLWLALNSQNPFTSTGLRTADVFAALLHRCPNLPDLAHHLNWPLEHLQVIEAYKNSSTRYYFPTIPELLTAFPAFTLVSTTITNPRFPQCPTLRLQRNL